MTDIIMCWYRWPPLFSCLFSLSPIPRCSRETGFGTEDMGFEPQIRKAVKEVKDTLRSAVVNSQGFTVWVRWVVSKGGDSMTAVT